MKLFIIFKHLFASLLSTRHLPVTVYRFFNLGTDESQKDETVEHLK